MIGPSDTWRQERKTYLGGTDISAIMGLNPWRGPFEVWVDKTQAVDTPAPDPRRAWIMQTGHYLEEAVALMYADREGLDRMDLTPGGLIRWHRAQHLAANPDRLILDSAKGLEIKTASEGELHSADSPWGPEGTEEIPDHYYLQCQWYAGITGMSEWDLAAFFLGRSREFRIYKIKFSPDLFAGMVEAAERFWKDHVLGGAAPTQAKNLDTLASYLAARASRNTGVIQANEAAEIAARNLNRIQYELRNLKEEESSAKAALLGMLSEAGGQKFQGSNWTAPVVSPKASTKVDWETIAREHAHKLGVDIPTDLISSHTRQTAGNPYLRLYWRDKKED